MFVDNNCAKIDSAVRHTLVICLPHSHNLPWNPVVQSHTSIVMVDTPAAAAAAQIQTAG